MNQYYRRIQRVYDQAEVIPFDERAKFVFISDCHRSDGSGADNLAKNYSIYQASLNHYEKAGFTYVELGDGDDNWETKQFSRIAAEYDQIFLQLSRLYRQGRMYMLYGNHDRVKQSPAWLQKELNTFHCRDEDFCRALFPDIKAHEGLILRHRQLDWELFLMHGHQADFFNDRLWRLSRTLVRYIWQPLELIGVQNPGRASTNPKKRIAVERRLSDWANRQPCLLIAGHTHRAVFPEDNTSRYFNDGCCVHPRLITAIELEGSILSLVKWSVSAQSDGTLCVKRSLAAEPAMLADFFA